MMIKVTVNCKDCIVLNLYDHANHQERKVSEIQPVQLVRDLIVSGIPFVIGADFNCKPDFGLCQATFPTRTDSKGNQTSIDDVLSTFP